MVSYEIIGNKEKAVAIIESSGNLKKDRLIAREISEKSKSIKSVLTKESKRKGRLRKREYKLIFGDKNTGVIHKEHGYLIKVDPQKTYFSPRELTERQRISKQVKGKEKILVMFSGVAPLIIAIKKRTPSSIVYGIELNRSAHRYAINNISLNKLDNIKLYQGDVKKIILQIRNKFNRILMPLPKSSSEFLDIALKRIKKGGIIHYYSWGKKEEYLKITDSIKKEAAECKKKIRILRLKKVLPYGPGINKIVIDIKCLN